MQLKSTLLLYSLSPSFTLSEPPSKLVPGPHVGSPPQYISYTDTLVQQEIATKKHSFLAGNNVYYMSQQRWGNPGNEDDETIGLIHPFFTDLRSRGTGIVEYGTTGVGNDFFGWDFHKFTEIAKGTVIGGSHTGGSEGEALPPVLITNNGLCVTAHETQVNFGLPTSMETCDEEDERQRWTYDPTTGLFANHVKGWCLFAGRPDLIGQQLKTWGCDETNDQMQWSYDEDSGIKSLSTKWTGGKCVSTAGLGSTPTTAECDQASSEQQVTLEEIGFEVRYENIKPTQIYWRPDGMTLHYLVGPAQVPVREEKFVASNDVISTVIYSDVPVVIEFTGKSFARPDFRTVSKSATCNFDEVNNAIHIVEGGRVLAKVSESPEVILEADLMYSGMSTILSSSRPIKDYSQVEIDAGECRYTFRLPVDSDGTTLSWTMNDNYSLALDNVKEVLPDPLSHLNAKNEEMNHLLNYNIPHFRCPDEQIVRVYYYLWSIYLMLYKYVGKGQEVHHHTQTAVNNFLGMHNWDAVMQILVGSWTTDKPTWAYGNVLLWSELPSEAMSPKGMVPDNMGIGWNSGLFGGFHHAAHACGALQIYDHTGDLDFLAKAYNFFDALFTRSGGVQGEDFDASLCLGKMATALNKPFEDIVKWDLHMERYGGLDHYLNQRWDETRSCWLDCDPSSENGVHEWTSISQAYKSYFPSEWAQAMGEAWLKKGDPNGFYPNGAIPLLSIAKRDWDRVLCPGTLETNSCGRGYWSEFAVTPDTNYYMISGMYRHSVTKIANDATLGHFQLNHIQDGNLAAPESREADMAPWGDQYSNFNAGKLLLLIEGIGGFKVSQTDSVFTQAESLPTEWAYMEWKLPVRSVDDMETTWLDARAERFCGASSDQWTKQITILHNPLDTLVVNPWTEGALVINSEVKVDGQILDVQPDTVAQDRIGFTIEGANAKGKVTIVIELQAEDGIDLSSVSCSQKAESSEPTSSPSSSAGIPTSDQPTYLPTENPTTAQEATTLRTLVCGMNNKCSANEQTVEKTTVQAVRCCRDESHGGSSSSGWPFKCRSDAEATYSSSSGPFGQSRLGIIPDNLVGSLVGNCVETDFDSAIKTCEANNGRLCTPQEMSDRCTRGTGCNFNSRLVWTCIAGGDGCSNDAECCSGTCDAEGTCTAAQQQTLQRNGCCSWEGKDCSSWIPESNPDCQYKQSDCESNCGGNWQLF